MKFLFDLLPLIVFLVAYFWGESHAQAVQHFLNSTIAPYVKDGIIPADQASIILATLLTISVLAIQIVLTLLARQKVAKMHWIGFAMLLVLGGATVYFHDDLFIRLKPTALYWLFAAILGISATVYGKNLIETLMKETEISAPPQVWSRLNLAWILFFVTLGILNLVIAFALPRAYWVSFKTVGSIVLSFAFVLGQAIYLMRFAKSTAP